MTILLKKKKKMEKNFIESKRLEEVLEKIKEYKQHVGSDNWSGISFDDVTNEDIQNLVSLMLAENKETTKVDDQNPFQNQYVVFEKLKFGVVIGQECYYFIEPFDS